MKIPGRNKRQEQHIIFRKCSNLIFMNCLNMCVCLWLRREGWVEVRRGMSSGLIPAWFKSDTLDMLLWSSLLLDCIAFYCINVYSSSRQASVSGCNIPDGNICLAELPNVICFSKFVLWSNFSWGLIFWSFPRWLLSCQDDAYEILQCLKMSFNMN